MLTFFPTQKRKLSIKMNKLLLKLISLLLLMQFMESECQNDILSSAQNDSAQYDELVKQGALKQYWKVLRRNEEITGFICACALIREANNKEYKIAKQLFRGYSCTETWIRYFRNSRKTGFGKSDIIPELLHPEEYDDSCGSALCTAYFVCSKHIQCDSDTVQVLNQLRTGTTKTIEQLFQKEAPKYLLTVENMKYINTFLKAVGQAPFSFKKFIKFETEYAIPKIRNDTDRLICPSYFRHPSSHI